MTKTTKTETFNFQAGDTVKGIVAGTFVVLGFRTIDKERYAQLKVIDLETGSLGSGELALPLSVLIKK